MYSYIFTIYTSSEMMSEAVMVRLLVAATVKIAAIAITNSNSKKKKEKQSVHLLNMLSRSQLSPPPTAILKSQRPSTLTM
jgi:hypothetical protein